MVDENGMALLFKQKTRQEYFRLACTYTGLATGFGAQSSSRSLTALSRAGREQNPYVPEYENHKIITTPTESGCPPSNNIMYIQREGASCMARGAQQP